MKFIQAIKAFMMVLAGAGGCEHRRVNLMEAPTYCQDCGYMVRIEWLMVQCRRCQSKRVPCKTFLGQIKPLQPYCRHCGYDGFRIVKKEHIDAYELMYALSEMTTVYAEEKELQKPAVRNPFRTKVTVETGDVFEAEVIRKTEFKGTKSAFGQSPYTWQTRQDPTRYGGGLTDPDFPSQVIPYKRSG